MRLGRRSSRSELELEPVLGEESAQHPEEAEGADGQHCDIELGCKSLPIQTH